MSWNILLDVLQLGAVGTIVGTISGALINKSSNRKIQKLQTEIDSKLEKLKIYESQSALKKSEQIERLWNIFIDILNNKKMPSEKDLNNLYFKVFLYAPDETVKSFIKWKDFVNNSDGTDESSKLAFTYFGEFIVSYRKELGQSDTNLSTDDFLRIFIKDYDEFMDK
ncbi:hypothetical protein [Bacillus pumilus]|uniref:hypothetical protein n=1 Tax=Bacillus pumilus TaxID=1408 RepID=UPI002FFDD7F4